MPLLHAIALAIDGDDLRMVEQAVQEGGRQGIVPSSVPHSAKLRLLVRIIGACS